MQQVATRWQGEALVGVPVRVIAGVYVSLRWGSIGVSKTKGTTQPLLELKKEVNSGS